MSDNLLDFIKNVQKDIQSKSYSYVFFNSETGDIEKISNSREEIQNFSFIKVLTQNLDDIFTGKKRIEDYKVVHNLQKDSHDLIFLNDEIIVPHIGDKIYQIPKVSESKIHSYDLTVRQDIREKFWHFFINDNVKQITNKLFFSITAKNDPNILYRTFIVDTRIDKGCVSFPFVYEKEFDNKNISVYTNKVLNKYAHEVFDE
jgi:hypothetical protein